MNDGVKIIAERLLADPSQLQDGALRSVWVRLAELVEENYKEMFTNEEINHIRQSKIDAMRLEFSALVLDCLEDRADSHIAIPKSKRQIEQIEQKRRMDEMDMNRYIMRGQTATGTTGLGGMSGGFGSVTGLGGF